MPSQTTTVRTDSEGYLVDPENWNEDVAREIAGKENINLGPEHWDVLRFMRGYFEEHRVAADARFVIKYLTGKYGVPGRDLLYKLFPYGYVQQACKIAGMKRPRAWSTG